MSACRNQATPQITAMILHDLTHFGQPMTSFTSCGADFRESKMCRADVRGYPALVVIFVVKSCDRIM